MPHTRITPQTWHVNSHKKTSNTSSLFDFTDSSNSNTTSDNNGINSGVDSNFSVSKTSAMSMNTTTIKKQLKLPTQTGKRKKERILFFFKDFINKIKIINRINKISLNL